MKIARVAAAIFCYEFRISIMYEVPRPVSGIISQSVLRVGIRDENRTQKMSVRVKARCDRKLGRQASGLPGCLHRSSSFTMYVLVYEE